MNSKDLKTLRELLSSSHKIAVIPHKNPDGDAIGASLAMWHYLKNTGHEALVVVPNDYPRFLKWMPGTSQVTNMEKESQKAGDFLAEADLIFVLDFNHPGRAGSLQPLLESSSANIVMVDHHQEPGTFARLTYSDVTMSSTCEMVYNLLEGLGELEILGPEIANCLYAGILTDTGSFKYSATSSQTHRVAADLIDRGAESTEIHRKIFDTNSPSRLRLLGCALRNLVLLEEYNTTYISLSQEELDKHQFKKGDTEGFVNYGLTLEGVRFAVIFIENAEEGIIKISLRSQGNFSVNNFARTHFNGGGHQNAAGGRSELSMEKTISYFKSVLETYKDELTP